MLKTGLQWFEKKCLHLERWEPKVVFFRKGELAKEVWVRVVGLPSYLWS